MKRRKNAAVRIVNELIEDGERTSEHPVEIVLYRQGARIGADRGVLWADGGFLGFTGNACSFLLRGCDLDRFNGYCSFEVYDNGVPIQVHLCFLELGSNVFASMSLAANAPQLENFREAVRQMFQIPTPPGLAQLPPLRSYREQWRREAAIPFERPRNNLVP